MNGVVESVIHNSARHLSALCVMIISLVATQTYGQDVVTVPTASYSYLPEPGAERQFIDLTALSAEIDESAYTFETALALSATTLEELQALRDNPLIQSLTGDTSQFLADGLLQGGASTGAAMVMLGVTAIAAEKCKELDTGQGDNFVIYKDVMLGRSSMRAVQNSFNTSTNKGLGRGQFDIYTTKFALCRNQINNDIVGIPINVRWVFNVNGDSLIMSQGNLTGPKGRPYKQNFRAEGTGIQVVLMEIDGQPLPPDHPVYLVVEDACIDIWLPEVVSTFDISFPVSIPDKGVFCAGGYCKDKPPGLDATQ